MVATLLLHFFRENRCLVTSALHFWKCELNASCPSWTGAFTQLFTTSVSDSKRWSWVIPSASGRLEMLAGMGKDISASSYAYLNP